jgi:hypothetical protein
MLLYYFHCIIAWGKATHYNILMTFTQITPRTTPGAQVSAIDKQSYRLSIPAGPPKEYRLSQLDDYSQLSRAHFPWRPPLTISLQARASHNQIPGTWGFGLWNDPFSMKLGFDGNQMLPALPNAAWFFFASPPNHLSFTDQLPGNGALAATFRSPPIPVWVFTPCILGIPLLLLPPAARLIRKLASRVISQDATQLDLDPTAWHRYRLDWDTKQVKFFLDDRLVLTTQESPRGPLGFVLWVDNQYAAWTPDGRLKYGTLHSSSSWIEVKHLVIQPGARE